MRIYNTKPLKIYILCLGKYLVGGCDTFLSQCCVSWSAFGTLGHIYSWTGNPSFSMDIQGLVLNGTPNIVTGRMFLNSQKYMHQFKQLPVSFHPIFIILSPYCPGPKDEKCYQITCINSFITTFLSISTTTFRNHKTCR